MSTWEANSVRDLPLGQGLATRSQRLGAVAAGGITGSMAAFALGGDIGLTAGILALALLVGLVASWSP